MFEQPSILTLVFYTVLQYAAIGFGYSVGVLPLALTFVYLRERIVDALYLKRMAHVAGPINDGSDELLQKFGLSVTDEPK